MKKCFLAGEKYLLELAQKGRKVYGAQMVAASVLAGEDVVGRRRKLITVGLKATNQVPQVCQAKALLLLQGDHPLAKLYITRTHEKGHEGAVSTVLSTDQGRKFQ